MSDTMTATEAVATEAVAIEASVIEDSATETVAGCTVETDGTFRKVHNAAGKLLGTVALIDGSHWSHPFRGGIPRGHETLESSVQTLIEVDMFSMDKSGKARDKGQQTPADPKRRALEQVTVHTRRLVKFDRELRTAQNAVTRQSDLADKWTGNVITAQGKVESARAKLQAEDVVSIATERAAAEAGVLEQRQMYADTIAEMRAKVLEQRNAAKDEARELGAEQREIEAAAAKGKPKPRAAK